MSDVVFETCTHSSHSRNLSLFQLACDFDMPERSGLSSEKRIICAQVVVDWKLYKGRVVSDLYVNEVFKHRTSTRWPVKLRQ